MNLTTMNKIFRIKIRKFSEKIKSFFTKKFAVSGILFLFFAVFSISAYFVKYNYEPLPEENVNPEKIQRVLSSNFEFLQAEAKKITELALISQDSLFEYIKQKEKVYDKKFCGFFVYEDNSLKYWTSNSIPLPTSTTFHFFDKSLIYLNNGWYLCHACEKGNIHTAGIFLIKKEYSIENELLNNEFNPLLDIDKNIMLNTEPIDNSININIPEHNISFYLGLKNKNNPTLKEFGVKHIFILLSSLFFVLLIFSISAQFIKIKPKSGLYILPLTAIVIAVARYYSLKYGLYSGFNDWALFSPEIFAQSLWLSSLGEYLISVVVFLLFSIFFFKNFKIEILRKIPAIFSVLMSIGLGSIFAVLSLFISELMKGIVINSSISFTFENILLLDIYSILGIIIIGAVILSFILILFRIAFELRQYLNLKVIILTLIIFTVGAFYLSSSKSYEEKEILIFAMLFVFLWIWLSISATKHKVSYFSLIVFVFISSLIISEHFSRISTKKELESYKVITYNLASERDINAEYFLKEIYNQLKYDTKLEQYIKNKDITGIENYIKGVVSSKRYFNKYDLQITACLEKDSLIFTFEPNKINCHEFFQKQIEDFGIVIPGTNFYYLENHNGRISYLGEIASKLFDGERLNIYIEADSKIFSEGLGYPELLLDSKQTVKKTTRKINYAKYHKGKLISSKGDYKYQFSLISQDSDTAEYSVFTANGYVHFKYRPDSENLIIVSKPDTQYSKELASFTYILAFLFIIFNFSWIIFNLINKKIFKGISLKEKTQIAFISMLIIALLATGAISIMFIIDGYKQKQKETVLDKIYSVLIELEYKIGDRDTLDYKDVEYLNSLLIKFSNVFYTDINVFDLNGVLLASSRTELFDKGLKGRYMDRRAYEELILNKSGAVVINENIDNINYLSAYIPFRNFNNDVIAYLNLPYFAKQNEFKEEISNFVIAFSNIFLILILFSILAGILISRNLTRPLSMIQERIKAMDIKKSAEKIYYSRNDELGGLIREYNRKIDELSESAIKLAQSEREFAWREMAKQIAHEIKNPLTPMKLSVQYLERAYEQKDEKWEETFRRVCRTLIEQIDVLSEIANEFSNFAKLPAPKTEEVNIAEVVEYSVQLFAHEDNTEIRVNNLINSKPIVLADREQLIRVFNNLIKNSIQAIPFGKNGIIEISLKENEQYYIITVKDNGVGIPEEMREKIFEPNFTTKSGGMGLGLSIIKSMLKNINAKISFTTEVNVGTEFKVEIPKK